MAISYPLCLRLNTESDTGRNLRLTDRQPGPGQGSGGSYFTDPRKLVRAMRWDRYEIPNVQAFAELVERYRPEWFGTFTFDPKRFPNLSYSAAWRFFRHWCNQQRRVSKLQPQYLAVVAPQKWTGMPHVHAVLVNCGDASYVSASERWQALYGHAQVDRYRRDLNGRFYLGLNYVLTQRGHTELDCSRGLKHFDRGTAGPEAVCCTRPSDLPARAAVGAAGCP